MIIHFIILLKYIIMPYYSIYIYIYIYIYIIRKILIYTLNYIVGFALYYNIQYINCTIYWSPLYP